MAHTPRPRDEILKALAPPQPSEIVRPEAWYGSQKADDRFPLAFVWIAIFAAALVVPWLLTEL